MKFKTFYNPPNKIQSVLDLETKFVDQSEADMVGLQYQLQRYGLDGLQARFEATKEKFGYADTRLIPSFAEVQNRIVQGTEYFNSLPSEIRAKFGHKPAEFYSYLEANPQEALEKGYISGEKAEELLKNIKVDTKVDTQPVESVKDVQEVKDEENVSA